MRPVEGLTLGERYTLVRRIAMGGMGEVWVARDEKLAREIAVKVLREEYTGNEDFLRRLRTEARNSSTLVHPNIAQMFDYGEERGAGYLVMELVLGEPLADLLEREPVLQPARLLPILAQTARGLHAAHLAGVVHRDVKPGNILLEHSGTVKITDFGVSVAQNQVPMTATGMVMGTAQYLSPEQAVGQSATGASDIYALGVVAYEATAGRRPFTGRTPVDIAIAHVNAPVPLLPTSVHPGLAETITKMLEKDPAQRISSADQLARHLDMLAAEIAEDPFGSSRYARRSRRESRDGQAATRSGNGRNGAVQPGPSHARRQTPFGGGRHTTVANAQSAPPARSAARRPGATAPGRPRAGTAAAARTASPTPRGSARPPAPTGRTPTGGRTRPRRAAPARTRSARPLPGTGRTRPATAPTPPGTGRTPPGTARRRARTAPTPTGRRAARATSRRRRRAGRTAPGPTRPAATCTRHARTDGGSPSKAAREGTLGKGEVCRPTSNAGWAGSRTGSVSACPGRSSRSSRCCSWSSSSRSSPGAETTAL
nr:hypothetical protein GCM10025730_32010 [Promicromonospora thailandica]